MSAFTANPGLRPGTLPWLTWLYLAALWLTASSLARGSDPVRPGYETGPANVVKIHLDLVRALEAKKRSGLPEQPVLLDQTRTPILTVPRDGAVRCSTGFVDLMNRLAHAKAIDLVEPGFLQSYVDALARSADGSVPELPESSKAWEFDTLNHQRGYFNQMTASLLAINLAHHYLGHCRKYEARLGTEAAGGPAQLQPMLSSSEWNDSVLKGAKNALDCGLAVEGLQTLLTAFNSMKSPPPWTPGFVPLKTDAARLNKQLTRLEKDFFLAEK